MSGGDAGGEHEGRAEGRGTRESRLTVAGGPIG
jgi:hypothetical protein